MAEVVTAVAQTLRRGGLVALPTDTVYGVAASPRFAARLYRLKSRRYHKPLAISVADVDDIYDCAKVTVPRCLLEDLLPGPVTVVFERGDSVPRELNPDTKLVGVRIPNSAFVRALCREMAQPLALTSANVSGDVSSLKVSEFECLWPSLDMVVDGGALPNCSHAREGSTVIDLSVPGTFGVLRPGCALKQTAKILTSSRYDLVKKT